MNPRDDAMRLRSLVRHACELDVMAFKPGNVSMASAGHGMQAADFQSSAAAIAAPLCQPQSSVGERIWHATEASWKVVPLNLNLGIVLLAAPLIQATLTRGPGSDLHDEVVRVLANLNVADAELAYRAIRQAQPGGLSRSRRHDVCNAPQVTLLQAMQEARDRDAIARAYVTGFRDVFVVGVPLLRAALTRFASESWAMVAVYLGFLSRFPDTHVGRKWGTATAQRVCREALDVDRAFQAARDPTRCMPALTAFDKSLKQRGINPGTSADLSVAAYLALRFSELFFHPEGEVVQMTSSSFPTGAPAPTSVN
jgi:triphosphoribosyl-dephospho-CoA synthase